MSQNPLNAKALRAAIEAARNAEENCDPAIEAAIRAYIASQEAAAPSEEPVAWQAEAKAHVVGLRQCSIFAEDAGPSIAKQMRESADFIEAALFASPAVAPVASSEEPVAYASAGQLNGFEDRPGDEGGVYIPLRKTPLGQFQMPLYSAPAAPVAVSVKPFVPSERLEQLIGTQAASEAETHDMAVELILHRRVALSSIIPDPFGLSGEQIETLRSNGLKPEEIAGDQRTQARRVSELLHWFVRLARDSANPKWTRSHAFELAYYLATTDDRAPFDISAVERAAWLRGLQEPAEVRDMAVRHGWIPALSSIIPATKGGEVVVEALTDAEDTLRLVEQPSFRDPRHGDEIEALGLRIGFGALMSSASASWRAHLAADGYPVGGEFVAGPCHGTVLSTLSKIRKALAALSAQDTDGVAKT